MDTESTPSAFLFLKDLRFGNSRVIGLGVMGLGSSGIGLEEAELNVGAVLVDLARVGVEGRPEPGF